MPATLMKLWISRIVLSLLLLMIATPGLAVALVPKKEFSEREQERILLPCRRASPDRKIRCEVRELKRAEAEWGKSNPVNAFAIYDWMDLSGKHRRDRLQKERLDAFAQHWERTRKVYSEFEPTTDVNTKRLPYVNSIRESRLDCMYVQHGRARTRCFDIQVDVSQKMMRTPPR